MGVTKLANADAFVRAGPGLFDLKASVTKYIGRLRLARPKGAARNLSASAMAERARLAKVQADKFEIANKMKLSLLVEASAVETEWSGVLRTVRASMLTVPSRVAARLPHLTPHDVREIDAEVRAVLTEVGNNGRDR
jgi:phage terminase Nu1 subunit (DNA packaging protein)